MACRLYGLKTVRLERGQGRDGTAMGGERRVESSAGPC